MDIVTQVMQKVNEVFSDKKLEEIARETGFIKRKRKIEAKKFLVNILLLKLESPETSLEDLVYEFNNFTTSGDATGIDPTETINFGLNGPYLSLVVKV